MTAPEADNRASALGPCSSGAAVAWVCNKCHVIRYGGGEQSRQMAESCCDATCENVLETGAICGKKARRGWRVCDECHQRITAREAASAKADRIARAVKIPANEYRGVVSCEGGPRGSSLVGDGYYRSIDELLTLCHDAGVAVPEYVWACDEYSPSTSADDVIESALDEAHEEASDSISRADVAELEKLLAAWWEKQGIVWYVENTEIAVHIPLYLREPRLDAGYEPPYSDPDV